MRISDWSSDVCSSDLTIQPVAAQVDPINGKFPADTRGAATREPGQAPLSMRRFVPLHGSDPATYVAPSSSRSPTYPIDNRHILSIRCGDFQRWGAPPCIPRSEEHTSELQSLMRISYAVFCLKKKRNTTARK